MKAKKKVNDGIFELRLKLSKKALQELRELQQLVGADSITQLMINSIKLFKYLKEEQVRGAVIIIHRAGYKDRELEYIE